MPASRVALRQDYDAARLRRLARGSRDNRQTRRLLALAAVYDGMILDDALVLRALSGPHPARSIRQFLTPLGRMVRMDSPLPHK